MRIGVPREIKRQEGRVALLAAQVAVLVQGGHTVIVEQSAGVASGAGDGAYEAAGAVMAVSGPAVYADVELVVKVKEILPVEFDLLERRHIVLTNLHGAADRALIDRLLEVGLIAIAAEEIHRFGSPNSPLAGEVGALEGLRLTLAPHGGTGRPFLAHFGAPATRAVVLGLGGVGRGALRTLLRLGVSVVGLDMSEAARRQAALDWPDADFTTADVGALADHLADADMVVNCVLWDKSRGDHLLSRAMLRAMKPTAVIVDISCDSAGSIETSRPTSWAEPVYTVDGIRHFAVDNIPGAVPVAASAGYAAAILPHVLAIAEQGALEACRRDPWLARGLTCARGILTLPEVGRVQNRDVTAVDDLLASEVL